MSLQNQQVKQMQQPQRPTTGTDTVVVGCDLPSGFICRLYRKDMRTERTPMGTSMQVERFVPTGDKEFVLNGPGAGTAPRRYGYALTYGIPSDFWNEWLKYNSDSDLVKNKHIVWGASVEKASDRAKKLKGNKTGLERIDPNNIPTNDMRFKPRTSEEQSAKFVDQDVDG